MEMLMSVETDGQHCERGVWATRFFDADASELARLLTQSEGRDAIESTIDGMRRSRDRLMMLAAGCELAACLFESATRTD
jgi:hypothetical protein